MIHTYPKNDFKREARILKSMFDPGAYNLLQRLDVMVAGGTLTSLFSNREINDIDLYFRSWDDLEVFVTYMHDAELRSGEHDLTPYTRGWNPEKRTYRRFKALDGLALEQVDFKMFIDESRDELGKPAPAEPKPMTLEELQEAAKNIEPSKIQLALARLRSGSDGTFKPVGGDEADDYYFMRSLGMTDKSVMYSNRQSPVVQCIGFDVFETPQKIFDKFDFTINMGAFCFADESWHFDGDFLKHIAQKVLVINPDTDYPIISLLRAGKYQARGYTISRRETMKLGLSTTRLNISSWEDAKAHLSGMYGTNVETLFNEARPFTFDLLFDKLDNAGDKIVSMIATDKEKGDRSNINHVSLDPVSQFQTINTLRHHTNRPHYSKVFGVCKSKRFYLMEKDNENQKVHVGMTDLDDQFRYSVELFFDEEDARARMKHYAEKEGGGVLLEVKILKIKHLGQKSHDTAHMKYPGGTESKHRPDYPSCVISKYIESNGDFS